MDKRQQELLQASLDAALLALEATPRIILSIQASISRVRDMIAEDRNPTEEELQEQHERLKAQTAILQSVVDADSNAVPG